MRKQYKDIRKYTFLLIVWILSIFANGQDNNYTKVHNFQAPSVAAFNTYGAIPVSLYTGTPSINVPIYTIKEGEVEIPIELKYNINNVKPNMHPGVTGLGWSLIAGGNITRTQNGAFFDEFNIYGYLDNENLLADNWYDNVTVSTSNQDFLDKTAAWFSPQRLLFESNSQFYTNHSTPSSFKDLVPDKFSFNFLNYSGAFYRSHTGKWVVDSETPFLVEYEVIGYENTRDQIAVPAKRVPTLKPQSTIKSFTLTAPDGIKFVFGGIDAIDYSVSYYNQGYDYSFPVATTWHLSKIIFPQSDVPAAIKKEIEFEYELSTPNLEGNWSFWLASNSSFLGNMTSGKGLSLQLVMPVLLKRIKSSNLGPIIDFSYKETIELEYPEVFFEQLSNYTGGSVSINLANYINEENAYRPYKYIQSEKEIKWQQLDKINLYYPNLEFELEYTDSKAERLKLQTVKKVIGSSAERFSFEYNTRKLPPYFTGHYDHMGFYNGRDFSFTLSPDFYASPEKGTMEEYARSFYYARQPDGSANGEYVSAEVLNKISYPTGGSSTFEYEPHYARQTVSADRQSLNNDSRYPGGLRIKKIRSYTNDKKLAFTNSYYYSAEFNPQDKERGYDSGIAGFTPQYLWEVFEGGVSKVKYLTSGGTSQTFFNLSESSHIGYSTVTECKEDIYGNIEGYTTYNYTNYGPGYFDMPALASVYSQSLSPFTPFASNGKKRGQLLSKNIYDKNNNLKEEIVYIYEKQSNEKIRFIDLQKVGPPNVERIFGGSNELDIFDYRVSSEVRSLYENSQVVKQSTTYQYDNKKQLKERRIENSLGKEYILTYKYPYNFSEPIYQSMVLKNMLSPVIEKITTYNNKETERVKTSYFSNPIKTYGYIVPEKVQTSLSGAVSLRTNITYDQYDKQGNLCQYTEMDGTKVSYLWGYKGQYPIAEIKNATYEQVSSALKVTPESLSSAAEPDMDLVNALREELPRTQVTAYTYSPLIGIKSVTDPKGLTTKYGYDRVGRLGTILLAEDGRDKIIKVYGYDMPGYIHLRNPDYVDPKPEPIDPENLTPDPYKKGKASSVLINIGAKGEGSYGLTGWNYDTQKVEVSNVITKTYKTIEASEYQWTTENLRLKYGIYGANINMTWVNLTQADVDKYANEYLNGQKIPLEEFEQIFGTWATLYPTAMMYRNIYWGVPTGPGTFDHTWGLPTKEDIWQLYGQAPRTTGNVYEDIKDFLFASACDNKFGWTQNMFNRRNISGLTLTPLGMRESKDGGAIYGFGQVASLQTAKDENIEILSDRDLSGNSGIISSGYSYHFTQARHRRPMTDQELGYKMYIDAANDQILMLPYNQTSLLPELAKGLERGIALRYTNREHLKVLKKWSEIQAEAKEIKSKLAPTNYPAPPVLLPCEKEPEPEVTADPYTKGKESAVLINIGARGDGSYNLAGWNYDTKKVELNNVITKTYKTIEASEYQWTTENLRLKYGNYVNILMDWANLTQGDVDKYSTDYLGGRTIPLDEFEQVYGTWATLYETAMMYRNIYWGVPTGPGTFDHTWGLPTKEDIWQLYGQAPRISDNLYNDIKDFLFASSSDFNFGWTQGLFKNKNTSGLTLTPLGMRESYNGGAIYGFGQVTSLQTSVRKGIETLSDRDLSTNSGLISNADSYHFTQARHRRPLTDQELGYKMYIDAANDQVLMLPYDQVSTLPELPKGLERGVALRYANRKAMKVVKKWSEIQAEAAMIMSKITKSS